MKEYKINKNDAGQRLDKYLSKAVPLLPGGLMHKYLRLKRIKLNGKRAELTDRNRMQEDYLVKIARTIEKGEPDKNASFEIQKDASAVENKDIAPEMENILDEYPAPLEQSNLETYNWENSRDLLRSVYVLDPMTGKPMMDGNQPQTRGSDEQKMLEQLFNSAKEQQTRLNNTRAQLSEMRGKLEEVVQELNKLKPEARKDKVTIDDKNAKITKLEEEKTTLEDMIKKLKGQIIILSTDEEIVSNYIDVVADVISNTFVLNHTALGNTEILSGTYFGGRS